MAYEKSWSNWWRTFLGCSPDGFRETLRILQDLYLDAMRHAKLHTQHAERMQYRQFRESLLRIAADEARHAEWLAGKITLLGGTLPSVPETSTGERNSWQYLLADLNEEQHSSADLLQQIRTVREQLPDIAEGLERIYQEGLRHRAEIRDMLMRSDPQSIWPA